MSKPSVARVHNLYPYSGRYPATERLWVARLLSLLTPVEVQDYERRVLSEAQRNPNPANRKIFDGEKGRIAAEVMQNHRRRGNHA